MLSFAIHCVLCGGKKFWISIQLLPINRWRIYPSYGGNKSEVWSLVSIFFGGFINGNCFFGIFVVVFSITSKENFMSRSRFNKLRFNIGLLPKLWSYFKQIWKERRSYNFYSFYGHWVTSFFTLSERYCQYPIFSWRKSKWKWKILPIYPIIWPEKKRREAVNIRVH